MKGRILLAALLLAGRAWAADPAAEYAARAAKLSEKDAKGWLALAGFCEENLLWEKRTEALRKAVAAEPDNAQARGRLDERKWGKDWLPAGEAEAKEIGENRAKGLAFYGSKWIPAKDAEKRRGADRKAVGWDMDFRMDTEHLVIHSSQPLEETWKLAAILESEIEAYRKTYGKFWILEPKPKPSRVFVFGDRATYERIVQAQTGFSPGPWQVGFYFPDNQVLYIGVSTEVTSAEWRRVATKIAVHEMFHALDHQLARLVLDGGSIPMWLIEGRADYFGNGIAGRQVLPGSLHLPPGDAEPKDLGKALASTPLATLLGMSRAEWEQGEVVERYALSWALVHYLLHAEDGRRAPAFRAFLKGVPGHASRADFEKAMGKISELEPAFKAWAESTLIQAALASRDEKP